MEIEKIKNSSKVNVEIEGISVPDDDVILYLLNKYKDKLSDRNIKSLFYSINESIKYYEEDLKNAKSK